MATVRPILPSPESSSSSLTPAISQDASCPDGATPSPASSVSPSPEDYPKVTSSPPSQALTNPSQPFILPSASLFPPRSGNQPPPLTPRKSPTPTTIPNPFFPSIFPPGTEDHLLKIAIVNRSYFISSIRREYRKKTERKEEHASVFYPTDDEDTDDERGVLSRKQQEWFKRKMEREEKVERGEYVDGDSGDSEESEEDEEEDGCLLDQIEPIPFDEPESSSPNEAGDSSTQIRNQRVSLGTAATQIITSIPPLAHESKSPDETTPLLLQPAETRKRKRDGGFGCGLASKVAMVLCSSIALFVDVCFGIGEGEEV